MIIYLKAMLIPMLIKAVLATRQPGICAAVFSAAIFLNGVMFDMATAESTMPDVLERTAWAAAGSFVYFWLLEKTQDMGFIYWVVLAVGVPAMFYL